jgi:hypothetical protein
MLDLPGFVLASVREFCPRNASIIRMNKCRFRIQSREVPKFFPQLIKARPSLELELTTPLLTDIQRALHQNDHAALTNLAQRMRDLMAQQL